MRRGLIDGCGPPCSPLSRWRRAAAAPRKPAQETQPHPRPPRQGPRQPPTPRAPPPAPPRAHRLDSASRGSRSRWGRSSPPPTPPRPRPSTASGARRIEQLAYHIHAHLAVFVNGRLYALPAGIGIPGSTTEQTTEGPVAAGGQCFYWLHTHSSDGVIHIESPTQRIYTLGNFFDEWHQPLSANQVGDVHGKISRVLQRQAVEEEPAGDPAAAARGHPVQHRRAGAAAGEDQLGSHGSLAVGRDRRSPRAACRCAPAPTLMAYLECHAGEDHDRDDGRGDEPEVVDEVDRPPGRSGTPRTRSRPPRSPRRSRLLAGRSAPGTRWIPATHAGVSRIAITGWRSNTRSPRATAPTRSERSGPGATSTARPAFSPISQPMIPPTVAASQATITTVVMSR